MWEAIKEVLNGQNSIFVLVSIILIVVLIILLIKGNYLNVNTKVVRLGHSEQERAILRQQTEWTNQYIKGLYGIMKMRYPELDEYRTKLQLEYVYDEVVTWIMFNHITRSEMYIMVKQEKVKGMIYSAEIPQELKEEKFAQLIDKWVKEIINRLVDIREYYK